MTVIGRVEALSTLPEPLTGEPCIAIEYRASPPSVLSVTGIPHSTRAYTVTARQSADFMLSDGTVTLRVDASELTNQDVGELHAHLLAEHGLGLEVSIATILPGDQVKVRGRVVNVLEGDAYRTPPGTLRLIAEEVSLEARPSGKQA